MVINTLSIAKSTNKRPTWLSHQPRPNLLINPLSFLFRSSNQLRSSHHVPPPGCDWLSSHPLSGHTMPHETSSVLRPAFADEPLCCRGLLPSELLGFDCCWVSNNCSCPECSCLGQGVLGVAGVHSHPQVSLAQAAGAWGGEGAIPRNLVISQTNMRYWGRKGVRLGFSDHVLYLSRLVQSCVTSSQAVT